MAFDWKNSMYFISELLTDNITILLEEDKQYSENICKYILLKTLKGIEYLHEKEIVHRDIKSDNILFNQFGEVKISCFDKAAVLKNENKFKRRTLAGTNFWMAPEVVRSI